jgi:peptide/nickel transport system permease protein
MNKTSKEKYDSDAQSLMTHKQLVLHKFKRHRLAMVSLACLVVLYTLCIFSDFFAPYGASTRFTAQSSMPPQTLHLYDKYSKKFIGPFVYGLKTQRDPKTFEKVYKEDGNEIIRLQFFHHGDKYKLFGLLTTDIHLIGSDKGTICLMGTDAMGRDLLSRTLNGGRLSLSIGLVGVFLSMLLGLIMGGVAGFYGGKADNIIMRTVDLFMSLPTIPLWMGLAAAVPRNWSTIRTYFAITIILSFFGWTNIARVVRGKFLSLREEDYVLSARLSGATDAYIIRSHLIPSFISYIIVSLTLSIPGMIIGETTLSFLGLGLQAPAVSWGVLLKDAQNFRSIAMMPWLLIPGIFVILTVLSFNFVGDGLRDAADPYSH